MSHQEVCSGCAKPRPDVIECSVRIKTKVATFMLCARHRAPLEKVVAQIPAVETRSRLRNPVVTIAVEDIPRLPKRRTKR